MLSVDALSAMVTLHGFGRFFSRNPVKEAIVVSSASSSLKTGIVMSTVDGLVGFPHGLLSVLMFIALYDRPDELVKP